MSTALAGARSPSSARAQTTAGLTATLRVADRTPLQMHGVLFDASRSSGQVVTYVFHFGDGSVQPSYQPLSLHGYKAPGIYHAWVEVINASGQRVSSGPVRIRVRDGIPPVVRIGVPRPGQRMHISSSGLVLSGTVKDNVAVAGVQLAVQLVASRQHFTTHGACIWYDSHQYLLLSACGAPYFFNAQVRHGAMELPNRPRREDSQGHIRRARTSHRPGGQHQPFLRAKPSNHPSLHTGVMHESNMRNRRRRLRWLAATLLALVLIPSVALAAGHWRASGKLHTARYLASASLLGDGRVLVTGGFGSKMLASAEIFDPRVGRWTTVAPFFGPRFAHTGTLLGDGSVLITGGFNFTASYLSSAERYFPTSNTWQPAGDMATPRDNHTATLLLDGRVLVTGGFNRFGPAVSSSELYLPTSNRWTPVASLRTPRYHHTATLLPDGRVLVVGGEQDRAGDVVLLRTAEIYDPVRNRWQAAARLPFGLANQTATLLKDGRVLVVGGGDRAPGFQAGAEIYNPRRNRWSRAAPLPAPRAFHVAQLLHNGQVLVAGGINDHGSLASAWLYDPGKNRWRAAGSLTPAYREAATPLADGRVLVAGGQRYQGPPVANATIYSP